MALWQIPRSPAAPSLSRTVPQVLAALVRRDLDSLRWSWQSGLPPLAVRAYLLALASLCLVLLVHVGTGIPIGDLTRDTSAVAGLPFYVGLVSNVGALFWCATATVCLLTWATLTGAEDRHFHSFLLWSGLLTLLLLIDDFLMLHDGLLPALFGISDKPVYVAYGTFVMFYLVRFGRLIAQTDFRPLLLALLFFGASMTLDVLNRSHIPGYHLYEDGTKLLGIASWFAYFTTVSLASLRLRLRS
ncbi:MAG: hypothetical protein HY329_04695 [Chloroflexi bacterium]|nr:hypothetical protein [Chloroflexota bacterium]